MGCTVKRVCAALVLSLAATAARAQQQDPHAVQPERPTVATHAGTVAPGWLEIEAGVEHDRFAPGDASTMAPSVFKFGIAHNAQLSVFETGLSSGGSVSLGDSASG